MKETQTLSVESLCVSWESHRSPEAMFHFIHLNVWEDGPKSRHSLGGIPELSRHLLAYSGAGRSNTFPASGQWAQYSARLGGGRGTSQVSSLSVLLQNGAM